MALNIDHQNFGVVAEEWGLLKAAAGQQKIYNREASADMDGYSSLSAGALVEIGDKQVTGMTGLGGVNKLIYIITQLLTGDVPRCMKVTDSSDVDLGKFIEVDANDDEVLPRNVVINPANA